MPGLTVIADPARRLATRLEHRRSLAALRHLEDYVVETIFAAPGLLVASTHYPGYPLAVWDDDRFRVVLEGRLYDRTDADAGRELRALANALLGPEPTTARLARWIETVDGDFVAVLIDRHDECALVLNDRYGRLPVYYAARDGCVIVSRELPCFAALAGMRLRRLGIAEFLLFGFPLGDGTLFEGVSRLPPASTVAVPGGAVRTLAVHDFDRKDDVSAGDERSAVLLATNLVDACRKRTRPGRQNVVSLSGGIDSRMVAGALSSAGIAACATTLDRGPIGEARDTEIAPRVARRLAIPWRLYPFAPPTGSDAQWLLDLKAGANYLGMSHALSYLAAVRARHGAGITFFTGDQGDRILGDVTPVAALGDERALAEYIIRKESILPPGRVAALTGIGEADLMRAVLARLAAYPERTMAQKYVHFLFYERAVRWLFEGEDRNRCFFWHVTPFYAPDVFEPAMRLPDAVKRHHRLRARILALLAPSAADVENAGTGGVLGSSAFAARQRAEHVAKAAFLHLVGTGGERLLKRWLRRGRGHQKGSAVLQCVRQQVRGSERVRKYLDPDAVDAVLHEAKSYPREQFSVVLTVTSLIDALADHPVLEEFRDVALT